MREAAGRLAAPTRRHEQDSQRTAQGHRMLYFGLEDGTGSGFLAKTYTKTRARARPRRACDHSATQEVMDTYTCINWVLGR